METVSIIIDKCNTFYKTTGAYMYEVKGYVKEQVTINFEYNNKT
ncbi:MAG: hypothetical protein ACFFGP_15810 [Promethearchaeota archaeon]